MDLKRIWLLLFALIMCTGLPLSAQDETADPTLVIAWASDGNLFFWESETLEVRTLVTGEVGRSFISPLGTRVAYMALGDDGSEGLWAVDASGENPHEIAGGLFWNLNWADDETLFYSTLDLLSEPAIFYREDLFRANVVTGEIEEMPLGGMMTLNPSRTGATIVNTGVYQAAPGEIWYLPLNEPAAPVKLYEYEAISSGAHLAIPVRLRWLDDETIIFALPQPDAVENPQEAISEIWQVTTDGEAEQLGTIPGGVYTLPDWSPDGSQMVFSRNGPLDDPQIDAFSTAILIANHDGSDLRVVAEYPVYEVSEPRWLDDAHFTFDHDNAIWLAGPDSEPQRWLEGSGYGVFFASDGMTVYFVQGDDPATFDLRFARLGDDTFAPIATGNLLDLVDVVTIPAR